MSGENWLSDTATTQGSEKAVNGAKQIAAVVAAFYQELVTLGVPREQAGMIAAEWTKLTVSRLLAHDTRAKGKRR